MADSRRSARVPQESEVKTTALVRIAIAIATIAICMTAYSMLVALQTTSVS